MIFFNSINQLITCFVLVFLSVEKVDLSMHVLCYLAFFMSIKLICLLVSDTNLFCGQFNLTTTNLRTFPVSQWFCSSFWLKNKIK